MHRSRSLLVIIATVICLAAVVAACGGQSPAPGETPSPAGTEPTAQPTETGVVSPLPPPQSPLPTPTDVTEDQADGRATRLAPTDLVPPEMVPSQEPAGVTGEVPQELLDVVIEDLIERLGVDRVAITVEQAEYVIWRDGSLGCPQPDMMYTQALVPGYQIVLRVGEATYDYHASDRGYFLLCEQGLAQEPLPPGEGGLVDQ
jgi:hypothetical protein